MVDTVTVPGTLNFEELGFERRHEVDNVDNRGINSVRMKDANGFYVDVVQTHHEKEY